MPFETTRWSLIVTAGADAPGAEEALSELCRVYWPPVFAFVVRKGYSRPEAEDLVQEFFARLIEKRYVERACKEKGKFRTFLLTSANHFLSNEWDRRRAKKRSGDYNALPLDQLSDARWKRFASNTSTPEHSFEKQWALTVLERSFARLQEDQKTAQARLRFESLKQFITVSSPRTPYAKLAQELDMTEGALKVAVHRLKSQYREAIRSEVEETVPESADIDSEIKYLMQALGRPTS